MRVWAIVAGNEDADLNRDDEAARRVPALEGMRNATRETHRRLEERLDAVRRFAECASREALIRRYAALHVPADAALAEALEPVAGLEFGARSRAHLLSRFVGEAPAFPRPRSRAEALGLLYVLEGSTLGGRAILHALARQGVADPDLAFLDPYGAATGARWRSFLSVLERETEGDAERVGEAVFGAVRGFDHAERVLCGSPA